MSSSRTGSGHSRDQARRIFDSQSADSADPGPGHAESGNVASIDPVEQRGIESPPASAAGDTTPRDSTITEVPSAPPRTRTRTIHVRGRTSHAADSSHTPPVLVVQTRGETIESRHRGSIVEVGQDGSVRRVLGDPDTIVNLRSAVKPFGLTALIEAGGVEEFDLTPEELAIMAGSHSGEDLHVRTLQAVFRRAGLTQQLLGCGSEGAPLDQLTAARLARDGEKPGQVRHMCSGQHASMLLLCRIHDWTLEGYWRPDHPVQRLYAAAVALAFGMTPEMLVASTDSCGVPTYAVPLREVARAFAMLANPAAIPSSDPRSSMAAALDRIRTAAMAHPEMIAGTRERLDTALMRAVPGRVIAKVGAEGLRGLAVLPVRKGTGGTGVAIKIEDGGGFDRASSAAAVETLKQMGVLDPTALRALGGYHRPLALDPRGEVVGEAVADFELAPVGELI